jgi:hypothetical protein
MRMSVPPLILADRRTEGLPSAVVGVPERLSAEDTDIFEFHRMTGNIGLNGIDRLSGDCRNLCLSNPSFLQYLYFLFFIVCHRLTPPSLYAEKCAVCQGNLLDVSQRKRMI